MSLNSLILPDSSAYDAPYTPPRGGLRSPITWLGGKGRTRSRIIPLLTQIPQKRYLEPYGGAGWVLIGKPPIPDEVYNDIDPGLGHLFSVIADRKLAPLFAERIAEISYNRETYYTARDSWEAQTDPVERAALFCAAGRMNFGGNFAGGSYGVDPKGQNEKVWQGIPAIVPYLHARLRDVTIHTLDALEVIRMYDSEQTLIYIDPPYIASTRRGGGYRYELSDADHRDLVAALLSLRGNAILSAYAHYIYSPLLACGWRRLETEVGCSVVGRTEGTGLKGAGACANQKRLESIYVSRGIAEEVTRHAPKYGWTPK